MAMATATARREGPGRLAQWREAVDLTAGLIPLARLG